MSLLFHQSCNLFSSACILLNVSSTKPLHTCEFNFCINLSVSIVSNSFLINIADPLTKRDKCLTVFLDLAKAFETMPPPCLLNVLQMYRVTENVLNVFYLDDRSQIVNIDETFCEALHINIGITQGDVLGPILFITYINSLTNICTGGVFSGCT